MNFLCKQNTKYQKKKKCKKEPMEERKKNTISKNTTRKQQPASTFTTIQKGSIDIILKIAINPERTVPSDGYNHTITHSFTLHSFITIFFRVSAGGA